MGSLIDSSIFIAAERGDLALRSALAVLPMDEGDLFISAVTVFELLHGVHRASTEKRAVREAFVENALQTFPILAFDEPAARIFASIDAPLSAAGNRLPVEDLMIAATALANGHEVVTRDLRSFPRVPGLKWVKW
ncbi:MAG TPA: PIN domain-containing protein [Polyangia bacterium]|nr:PIN domain-containing protein [Polyangia bacterium]